MHNTFVMASEDEIIKKRGLDPNGKAQKYVDSEVIRRMVPYTPMILGTLADSAVAIPKVGSGLIRQKTPYARFQYYGKLMVSPTTGSSWAKRHEKKVLTNKDLIHNKSKHPMAGPFWFERMKSDHKEDILQGARKITGAK